MEMKTPSMLAACMIASFGCSAEPGAVDGGDITGPGAAPQLPAFNLLPEGASEDSYWQSTVSIDDSGMPYLVDAVELSEEEMLAGAEQMRLGEGGEVVEKAWGQVPCDNTNFDPLIMTQGDNFTGNRICFEDSSAFTDDWFFLGNWFWGSVQVSSNIGSVGDSNEFQYETWTDSTVQVTPQGFPGPITYPSTAACMTNVDTDGFGLTNVTPTGQQCHRYVTWIWLGELPAQF